MKFSLYTEMELAKDVPEFSLCCGDIVKLVEHHSGPEGQESYSVEFFNALGETAGVACIPNDVLDPLQSDEVLCARPASIR